MGFRQYSIAFFAVYSGIDINDTRGRATAVC